jgi:hypothetical protein
LLSNDFFSLVRENGSVKHWDTFWANTSIASAGGAEEVHKHTLKANM